MPLICFIRNVGLLLLCMGLIWPDATQGQVRFQHLGLDEGLPNSTVNKLLQDRQGFLWFATENGLVRYEGRSMRVFPKGINQPDRPNGSHITALLEDHRGNIWIGSKYSGLSVWHPDTESFSHPTYDPEQQRFSDKQHQLIRALHEDQNRRIWVSTGVGLALWDSLTEQLQAVGVQSHRFPLQSRSG